MQRRSSRWAHTSSWDSISSNNLLGICLENLPYPLLNLVGVVSKVVRSTCTPMFLAQMEIFLSEHGICGTLVVDSITGWFPISTLCQRFLVWTVTGQSQYWRGKTHCDRCISKLWSTHAIGAKTIMCRVCHVCCVCCPKLVVNRNWWCGAGQMLASLLDGLSCVP